MRRLLLTALLAAAPVGAFAQGIPAQPLRSVTWPLSRSGTTISLYGDVIPRDANTVTSVTFSDGAGLVDSKGLGWSTNGTVPLNAPSGVTPPSAGTFTDVNNYSIAPVSGHSALDFAGDFTLCLVFTGSPDGTYNQMAVSNGTYNSNGYYLYVGTGAGVVHVDTNAAGSSHADLATGNAISTTKVNVMCAGRSGTTQYVQLNNGTLASGASTAITQATGSSGYIGRDVGTGSWCRSLKIMQVWAATTTPSAGAFTAIFAAVKAKLGAQAAW